MKRHSGVYYSLSLLLTLVVAARPSPHYAAAAQGQNNKSGESEREDDRCDQLPDPRPGKQMALKNAATAGRPKDRQVIAELQRYWKKDANKRSAFIAAPSLLGAAAQAASPGHSL